MASYGQPGDVETFAHRRLVLHAGWLFRTNAEQFVVANRRVSFGWATALVGRQLDLGRSFNAAAPAAYEYGISGAFHGAVLMRDRAF